mmetsp:Transcript_29720/g.41837  ORF Transcript_29720/g.41837 Transcript_29720/m.41837 type:complete len:83 (+) Transcript_29720:691-939(+)
MAELVILANVIYSLMFQTLPPTSFSIAVASFYVLGRPYEAVIQGNDMSETRVLTNGDWCVRNDPVIPSIGEHIVTLEIFSIN